MKKQNLTFFIIVLSLLLAGPALSGEDWKMTLNVDGPGAKGTCRIGANADATDGQDYKHDVRAMMSSLNTNNLETYCYFPHPEWNDVSAENFKVDIKAHAQGVENQWTLEVLSNVTGDLTLSWPDIGQKYSGFTATLTDIDGGGGQVDMVATPYISFTNMVDVPRQFLISIFDPNAPVPDTLWADVDDLKVHLEWKHEDNPAIAGYTVWRQMPGGEFEKLNQALIEPGREFYLDKIKKKMLDSPRVMTIAYMVQTVAGDPPGDILKVSNIVEVKIQKKQKKNK